MEQKKKLYGKKKSLSKKQKFPFIWNENINNKIIIIITCAHKIYFKM